MNGPERSSVSNRVADFIEVGHAILNWDRKAALGSDFDRLAMNGPSAALAQPGFIGFDYGRLVLLGLNPGVAANRSPGRGFSSKLAEWDHKLTSWQGSRLIQAYEEVHDFWLQDLHGWRVWKMYIAPLLLELGLQPEHTAYLNFFQSPTVVGKKLTPRMLSAGWPWTKRQLEILEPAVVVAGGKKVGDLLRQNWPSPPFQILVQDRNRSLDTISTSGWMREAAAQIKVLLARAANSRPSVT